MRIFTAATTFANRKTYVHFILAVFHRFRLLAPHTVAQLAPKSQEAIEDQMYYHIFLQDNLNRAQLA